MTLNNFQKFLENLILKRHLVIFHRKHLEQFGNESLFGFVEPQEYVLGKDAKGKDETTQYEPILDTLRSLLEKDDVFAEVFNGHSSNDDTLGDFCDGQNFRGNALFSTNIMSIQVQLYYDEFCAANPLNNKVETMKFGAFYFVVGNIPPVYRSRLHVIQLALLCMASHLKDYTLERIVAPLLRDLRTLETTGYTLYGSISFISADNLGAHQIGGYQTHFNRGPVCRGCNVTSAELKDHLNCRNLEIRTQDKYEQQVRRVDNPDLKYVYGVKGDSVFNQLEHFHVTSGLPFDIAHDLFGIIPEALYLTIKHCVQEGYISLEYLNEVIETFNYDSSDVRNKPSPMSSEMASFKIKQTAAQAWCLLCHLPVMIGHRIPVDDSRWHVLLLLLDVVEYCMAPRVDKVMTEFFGYLIEFFSSYYREYIISMKPKFHYLLHYPRQMLEFGPLVFCWTLRFEGKHFVFKEISWRTKNRKNIMYTLAHRHEYYQAWCKSGSNNFLTRDIIQHTGGKVCLESCHKNYTGFYYLL